ncbi:putative hydrolase, NUDIX family [marine gamma proteobacterium HTCC2148]|nr:putative hydrolase, NUDIX family [marine gamma proteobacterium HTCC2148]
MWEFPGGKQEPGETIYQCLEREIYEELYVSARAGEVFAESLYMYEGGAINLVAILIELDSTEFSLSVHDAARWVKIESLLNYELAPADIPIAERIVEIYGGT